MDGDNGHGLRRPVSRDPAEGDGALSSGTDPAADPGREASQRAELEAILHPDLIEIARAELGHQPPGRRGSDGRSGDPRVAQAAVPAVEGEPPSALVPAPWRELIVSEEARWLRHQRPCVALRLEVIGATELGSRLGPDAESRVLAEFDVVLQATTRASDRYARSSPRGVVALLVETDVAGAVTAVERLQTAYRERLGPALRLWVASGVAAPLPDEGLAGAFRAADEALRADRQLAGRAGDGRAPSGLAAPSSVDRVRASLLELDQLLAEGLISGPEHEARRARTLDRL